MAQGIETPPNAIVEYVDESGKVVATEPFRDPGLEPDSWLAREQGKKKWRQHLAYGCGRAIGAALMMIIGMGWPAAAQTQVLWGVNGHSVWYYPGASLDDEMAVLRDLNMFFYRVDIHPNGVAADDQAVSDNLAAVLDAADRNGIYLAVTITPWVPSIDDETEATYYQKSYDRAFALASRFKGRGIFWELDNEIEHYAMVRPCEYRDDGYFWHCDWGDASGSSTLDYIADRYNRLRGDLNGLSDGIAAGAPGEWRMVNVSAGFHYGFLQRLINDGVQFEISAPHWYSTYGDIADPNNNIAQQLANLGKPIWITEFNRGYGSYGGNEADQGTVIGQMATEFCQIASQYGIAAAFVYELLDEAYFGDTSEATMGLINLVQDINGNWLYGPHKPAYGAMQNVTWLMSCPTGFSQ
jgi:putative glycosyl hydrolase